MVIDIEEVRRRNGAAVAPNPDKLLVKPPEAARMLSVSPRKLWSITSPRGDLPCLRLGPQCARYAVSDLEAWGAAKSGAAAKGPERMTL